MNHPYLNDQERAKAFAALEANPSATYRVWAAEWGWALPRVHRFLCSLERLGLIAMMHSRWGTVVQIRNGAETEPIHLPETEPRRKRNGAETEPIPLGTRYLDKQPRELEAGSGFTGTLINCMNGVLADRFGQEYRPVMHDNRASVAAGERLQAAGIDVDFAIAEVRGSCWLFNPSKHGRGELPRSLAYFERGIVKGWGMRAQQQLALLSSTEGGAAAESRKPRANGVPTPIADSIAELRRSAPEEVRSWRASYAANGGAPPTR